MLNINEKSIKEFKLVRPHYNFSYLAQVEMEKFKTLMRNTDYAKLEIVEDSYVEEAENEIVFGNTNRSGVEKISDYDEYRISIKGNKVYLNGGSPYATAMAISEFCKLVRKFDNITDDMSIVGSYKEAIKQYDLSKTYRPVWIDDFDGNEVDSKKWYIAEEEYTNRDAEGYSGKDQHRAWRNKESITIEDGYIKFHYSKDNKESTFINKDGVEKHSKGNFYGGAIRTGGIMKYRYGYIETSAMLPDGKSFWSTLWMRTYHSDSNGEVGPEIDVNECYGDSSKVDGGLHVWKRPGGFHDEWKTRAFGYLIGDETRRIRLPKEDEQKFCDAMHTFGVLWTEDRVAFTCDGKIYCDFDLNMPGAEDYKMAFSTVCVETILAASAGFCNCPMTMEYDDEVWEKYGRYIVDYVHLYQLYDNGKSILETNEEAKFKL